jgi:type IV pilus assembly protein PilE
MKALTTMNRQHRGFSLTELLISLAIVALMAGVAIPSYRNYVMRANRADATSALLRLASSQERFYLQNNRFAGDDELADAPPAGLGIAGTERGYYELEIESADLTAGYIARATAVAGERQADDEACAEFSVDQQGLRAALDSGDDDNTAECWR